MSVVYPEIVDRTVYVNLKFSKYTYTAYFNCPLDRMWLSVFDPESL